MGIWDYVSSAIGTISGWVTRSREIVGGATGKASETAVWTSQAVVERMPDWEGWQRIGWLVADHAIEHGTKPFTGGIPVYRFMKEELSNNKSQEKLELAKLKATIQILEKKIMELEELGQRMENLEKKLVEINQNSINQKSGLR